MKNGEPSTAEILLREFNSSHRTEESFRVGLLQALGELIDAYVALMKGLESNSKNLELVTQGLSKVAELLREIKLQAWRRA